MIPEERRKEILNKIKKSDIYTIDDLTKELGVSRVTVQRDVNLLKKRGLVDRIHGGVKIIREDGITFETRFSTRLKKNYREKLEIAKKALNYVSDSSILFIDSSTTSYIFSKELFKEKFIDLTIITNSPAILCEALSYPDLKVISTGGQLRRNFNMLFGNWVIDFLKKVNIDSAFISAAGLSIESGITTSDSELANILTMVFTRSKNINILADSSKFNQVGMLNISPVNNGMRIITDKGIDNNVITDFKKKSDIELIY